MTFPITLYTAPTRKDGQVIMAEHVNSLQVEVRGLESSLGLGILKGGRPALDPSVTYPTGAVSSDSYPTLEARVGAIESIAAHKHEFVSLKGGSTILPPAGSAPSLIIAPTSGVALQVTSSSGTNILLKGNGEISARSVVASEAAFDTLTAGGKVVLSATGASSDSFSLSTVASAESVVSLAPSASSHAISVSVVGSTPRSVLSASVAGGASGSVLDLRASADLTSLTMRDAVISSAAVLARLQVSHPTEVRVSSPKVTLGDGTKSVTVVGDALTAAKIVPTSVEAKTVTSDSVTSKSVTASQSLTATGSKLSGATEIGGTKASDSTVVRGKVSLDDYKTGFYPKADRNGKDGYLRYSRGPSLDQYPAPTDARNKWRLLSATADCDAAALIVAELVAPASGEAIVHITAKVQARDHRVAVSYDIIDSDGRAVVPANDPGTTDGVSSHGVEYNPPDGLSTVTLSSFDVVRGLTPGSRYGIAVVGHTAQLDKDSHKDDDAFARDYTMHIRNIKVAVTPVVGTLA